VEKGKVGYALRVGEKVGRRKEGSMKSGWETTRKRATRSKEGEGSRQPKEQSDTPTEYAAEVGTGEISTQQ